MKTDNLLEPAPSPNGKLVVPAWMVPYLITAAMLLQVVAAAVALPGPWTVDRTFMVLQGILGVLVGGVSAGLRK